MIRSGDLECYYGNALGTSDGQALTSFSVTQVTDAKTFRCNSLEADDFWYDAIFYGITGTNVADQWNHVKDNTNVGGTANDIELSVNLPGNPSIGNTFKLIHPGKNNMYRSTEVIPGMSHTDPVNVTGVDIRYVSFTNGTGNGTLSYTSSGQLLQWKAPGDVLGAGVAASATTTMTLYSGDDSKYVRVYIDNLGNLPGSDASDTNIALTQPVARVIPNTEAYQSETGITRYIVVFFKNINSTDTMNELKCWVDNRVDATTTTTSGLVIESSSFTVNDASSMPARSFWLLNTTRDDTRYVRYRSGNTLYTSAATGGLRGKTAVAWSAGDNVGVWTDVDVAEGTLSGDKLGVLSGYSYTSPTAYDDGIDYSNFAAGDMGAVVLREVVLDTVYPIESVVSNLHFKWW